MFETVLIANRGEIACRVITTLRRWGIRSVAVYSDPDADAKHVRMADVAVHLGGAAASDSYLDIEKIIRAAVDQHADAIHPGYGFLAENGSFAAACQAAGIVFIGPGIEALEVMGDKIRAKAQVAARGVPIVPGLAEPNLTDAQLADAIQDIGFPALIKPSAGGGGKGMHLVNHPGEIGEALAAARREALSSFGDDTLFVERFVRTPRHIEVQVLADNSGRTVHLGERECSLQRRHQKVIEEAPSPLLDSATRARIGEAACETARSVGYRGAGTVEFIVSADAPDEFYFMEMNTRLQVEHPVTEMVTGIDLVEWQLRIAAGEELDFGQEQVRLTGHAVEARVYAEDPAHGFLPTGGRIALLEEPTGDGVRVDSALVDGLTVSSDYDPMLAKVIAWAPTRAAALSKLRAALAGTVTLGVTTNVEFLRLLLADPDVAAGRLDTELIARRLPDFAFRRPDDELFAAAALLLHARESDHEAAGPWSVRNGWRLGENAFSSYRLHVVDSDATAVVAVRGEVGETTVMIDGRQPVRASVVLGTSTAQIRLGEVTKKVAFAARNQQLYFSDQGAQFCLVETTTERGPAAGAAESPELRSPMPGAVVAISAQDGALVDTGDPVLVIEAMKMEYVLRAANPGRVALMAGVGTQVTRDQVVAVVNALAE